MLSEQQIKEDMEFFRKLFEPLKTIEPDVILRLANKNPDIKNKPVPAGLKAKILQTITQNNGTKNEI